MQFSQLRYSTSAWDRTVPRAVLFLMVRSRTLKRVAIDVAAWGLALAVVAVLRFDLQVELVPRLQLVAAWLAASSLQVLAGMATTLYLGGRRYGSFEEVAVLAPVTAVGTAALTGLSLVTLPRLLPLSVAVGSGVLAFVLMGAVRYAWRLAMEHGQRPDPATATRLLVLGAGEAGAQIVTAMLTDRRSPYLPVALLDDDPDKRFLSIKGVPVAGTSEQLSQVARRFHADSLLIAVPSAGATQLRAVSDAADAAGLTVKVLPPVHELIDGRVGVEDIRPISTRDLLGRHEVEIDLDSIAGYLTGRRVLVTGAGGSIGSELCRQLCRFAPAELVLADRDESALHETQISMHGQASLDADDVELLDIRDRERLMEVFARHQPHVVFHAAALKHVTALERHPGEALKTNVLGTLALLETAAAYGVERFVNISTDKAADPINVLGYTKRLAERLTAHFGENEAGTYLSVRFGNVLGSRGSVLTVFQSQLEAGGPLTVTHPDVTRYFMTIEEAVRLVIQAGAVGRQGEVLVLDMGEPVPIAEVARRVAAQADPPAEVVFTGLHVGEKLHEQLLGRTEMDRRPVHPLISQVVAPPVDPDVVRELDLQLSADKLRDELYRFCEEDLEPAAAAS